MFNRHLARPVRISLLVAGLVLVTNLAGATSEIITLRSGNAPANSADPQITFFTSGVGGGPLSPNPFVDADFDAACLGPNATVVIPIFVWAQSLACDPAAQWIGTDTASSPGSTMYCQPFDVETCCIGHATLEFCWAADDYLGDPNSGEPNPAGVYLNGQMVSPLIAGGNYAAETQVGLIDVTSLVHCGANTLQVYNRDGGFAVSGVIYSATLEIVECGVEVQGSTWGSVKSLYR